MVVRLKGRGRGEAARLTAVLVAAFGIAGLLAPAAFGHGSMSDPLSRSLGCFLEGPESPRSDACKAAIALGGTQPFYDWMEVNVGDADGRHRQIIPDGQLCGAGREKYAGIDLARRDWPTSELVSGAGHRFLYQASTPHGGNFKLYVTRDDYDPSEPLRWDDLESKPFLTVDDPPVVNGDYVMDGVLPAGKSGRHLIYSVWQRFDSPEAFYTCSDVVFRGGAEEANLRVTSFQPQKAGRPLKLGVKCQRACSAKAGGHAIVSGSAKAKLKLKPVRAKLNAGEKTTLKLSPKGSKAKRRLKLLVKRGAKAKARIEVTAVDSAGVSSTAKLTVKLKA